jgi:hypothetical protein
VDCNDGCPTDANKTEPGICGCGVADTDSDSDGTADCNDGCPNDANKTEPGICGCGTADVDTDADGVTDCNDDCLDTEAINYDHNPTEPCFYCDDMDPMLYFNGLSELSPASAADAANAEITVDYTGGTEPLTLKIEDMEGIEADQILDVIDGSAYGALPGMYVATLIDSTGCDGRVETEVGPLEVYHDVLLEYSLCPVLGCTHEDASNYDAGANVNDGSCEFLVQNLLANPGGEDGINGWTVEQGIVESLTDGECDGRTPHSGTNYFCVGGLCDDSEYGLAVQEIDVSELADVIDAGEAELLYGGFLSDWSGSDLPEMRLAFLDEGGNSLDMTGMLSTLNTTWTELSGLATVPSGTRTVRCELHGTRNSGDDNDSYFDDLFLQWIVVGE